ncbi:MAG: S-layer homology domain-containing protein [Oscillospiraceae bacterium]|jgi:uncharacterized protein YkwD|nr:S-layer homology domain-containing protein [Oscillospiraceae bacterium]
MKHKRLLSVIVAIAIAVSALPTLALAGKTPSTWFTSDMRNANTAGLLTANAMKDFQRKMTRDEFCETVVLMAEKTLGRELALPARNPFVDAFSEYVLKAYQYGIVNGKDLSKGIFAPNDNVTREEIATMMVRAMQGIQRDLGKTLLSPPAGSLPFKDNASIYAVHLDNVKYAYSNGMFLGDNENRFNPKNDITSEECVAVAIRSFTAMHTKLDQYLTTSQLLDKTLANINIGYALGDLPTAVSQNIQLPTVGSGGAVITWASSNPYVIRVDGADGVVTVGSAINVILTATATLGGISRSKQFTLTTTPLTGDSLLVNSAKTALEIGFHNAGDTLESVTGDVYLPTTALGLPVAWTTTVPTTVTSNGVVTVPADSREITVYLTATFRSGAAYGTKQFTLKVHNAAFAPNSVLLHNISLGMTSAQVGVALGSAANPSIPKASVTLATGEVWQIFHSSATSYNNFVAVIYQSSKVVGVYTMVSGWATYLRDSASKTITVAAANQVPNVAVTVYTDTRNGNVQYAAFLSDKTSTVGSARALTASAVETIALDVINAFRYLYGSGTAGKAVLSANNALINSARAHSTDMGYYNIFNEAGSTAYKTYQARATNAGFAGLVTGLIGTNAVNPFDFVDTAVQVAADRASILSTTATVAGLGYAPGNSTTYRNFLTAVFGSGTQVTSVTAVPTSLQLNPGATTTIQLTFYPAGFADTPVVTSSNAAVFTIQPTPGASTATNVRSYTVYASANPQTASAYISVTNANGAAISGGAANNIPVTVSTAYATSLVVSSETQSNFVTANTSQPAPPVQNTLYYNYIIGVGNTFNFSAVAAAASGTPLITWTTSNLNVVRLNGTTSNTSTGGSVTLTGYAPGTATLNVSVPRSGGTFSVTVNIIVVSLNLTPSTSATINLSTPTLPISAAIAGLPANVALGTVNWASSNPAAVALESGTTGTTITVTAKAADKGTATITATATLTGTTTYTVKALTRPITISVTGQPDYATDITLSQPSIAVEKGNQGLVTVTTIPPSVKNRTVTIEPGYDTAIIDVSVLQTATGGTVTITGKTVGTTTVWINVPATATPGAVIRKSITVTVNPASVSVNITNALPSMTVGDSLTLQATTTPAGKIVTWSITTGNEFATIDTTTGHLTATAAGTITVTATVPAVPGETSLGQTSATITINPAP